MCFEITKTPLAQAKDSLKYAKSNLRHGLKYDYHKSTIAEYRRDVKIAERALAKLRAQRLKAKTAKKATRRMSRV